MMHKRCWPLALALAWIALDRPAPAADRVKVVGGAQSSGELAETSPTKVALQVGATKKEFSVNEIESVQFDAEPNDLSQARIAIRGHRYDDAVAMLAKINLTGLKRPEVIKDVEYYQALAAARLALAGTGSIAESGKRMFGYVKANADSFHYFEACETLGDLLAALGRYPDAETYYNKLAAAPWPDYKMRAGVLVGRALVSQKQFDQAAARFDQVLAVEAKGPEAEAQKSAAELGKAAALSGAGKTEEAVKLAEAVIAKADPANEELYARAYNILGNCYTAAGKKNQALLAFLHVDLLYPRPPEQHAEALANLATLWAAADKSDRAAQAKSMLKEKYPNSIWGAK